MNRPTRLRDLRPGYALRVAFFLTGTLVFLGAAILFASHAWHSQDAGQLMPGGRGRPLSSREGFEIAGGMLLFSLFYAWRSWQNIRRGAR
jgi:uncharacterized membrane protein (DUF4010 family)